MAAAARFGEVVVLAVPWDQVTTVLRQTGQLAGRILWDCTNPLAPDLSGLVLGTTTSGAEAVAMQAGGARVVKGISPFAEMLNGASPPAGAPKPAVFLCSDDGEAKQEIAALVVAIGAEPVDAGPLRERAVHRAGRHAASTARLCTGDGWPDRSGAGALHLSPTWSP